MTIVCRLKVPVGGNVHTTTVFECDSSYVEASSRYLWEVYGLSTAQYYLTRSALMIGDSEYVNVAVRFRLPGGKGGFGSQLRAQGTRMSSRKRSGGYEACRDLTGRRLRTVKEAQMIAEHLAKKPEMERKKQAEIRGRMERLIEIAERRPVFKDVEYIRQAQDLVDEAETAVHDAVLRDVATVAVEDDEPREGCSHRAKGKEKALLDLQEELGL